MREKKSGNDNATLHHGCDILITISIRYLIEQFLHPMFHGTRVHNFGSSYNSLGFKGCDIDMYANLNYDPWKEGSKGMPWSSF